MIGIYHHKTKDKKHKKNHQRSRLVAVGKDDAEVARLLNVLHQQFPKYNFSAHEVTDADDMEVQMTVQFFLHNS